MTRVCTFLLAFGACIVSVPEKVMAHEVRPGYLEITETSPNEFEILWKVPQQAGMRLRIEPVLPDSFTPTTPVRQQLTGEALLQRWTVESEEGLIGQTIRIDGLEETMTDVLVRIALVDDVVLVTRLTPATTSYVVPRAPSIVEVAWTYSILGIEHILLGIDHLLFVLGLLLIVDGRWKLVKTITAFTVAHSVTLAIATMGWVHVPGPPVEAIIALSIVFVASEVLKKQKGESGLTEQYPWIVAFSFGLLHGFGFAGALADVGLPTGDIPMALLTFNIGVEIGQLLFVVASWIVWQLFKLVAERPAEQIVKLLPYGIGSLAAFWSIERVAGFW